MDQQEQLLINKGKDFFLKKNFVKSLKYFTEAISLNPLNSSIFFEIGKVYERLKKNNQAFSDYTIEIEFNSDFAEDLKIGEMLEINFKNLT